MIKSDKRKLREIARARKKAWHRYLDLISDGWMASADKQLAAMRALDRRSDEIVAKYR